PVEVAAVGLERAGKRLAGGVAQRGGEEPGQHYIAVALPVPANLDSHLPSFVSCGGMRRIEQCPLCGGRRLPPFAMASGQRVLLHFAQVRCRGCGLLISQPQAGAEEIERFYAHTFYEEVWTDTA